MCVVCGERERVVCVCVRVCECVCVCVERVVCVCVERVVCVGGGRKSGVCVSVCVERVVCVCVCVCGERERVVCVCVCVSVERERESGVCLCVCESSGEIGVHACVGYSTFSVLYTLYYGELLTTDHIQCIKGHKVSQWDISICHHLLL